jgi:hypothetical protein
VRRHVVEHAFEQWRRGYGRAGFRANSTTIGYELQSNSGRWWVRARPFVVARYLKTSAGLVDESYVDPGLDLTLARDVRLYTYYSFHQDAFGGHEYPYQFTRDHASRVIAEYNTLSRRVSVSLLYSYTPRPTTAIYVGDGDLLLNERDAFDAHPRDGLYRVRSTFFVKLAVGWRR